MPVSSFMIQASLSAWQQPEKFQPVERIWVPIEEISPQLAIAVIAAEDQRFPDHFGIDVIELRNVLKSDGLTRGASTISQQVAKNLFLWSGRSYVRKGLEAGIAILIELTWSKKRILEVYLNTAQFGNGIFGAEAASKNFFKISASRLTKQQSARLAAVLPNPIIYSVSQTDSTVTKRQKRILRQMNNLGGVSFLAQLDLQ